MIKILGIFFQLLYHQFAWCYDFVASIVSRGEWIEWIKQIIPFIEGNEILEIAHGPGHLQVALNSGGRHIIGLDRSAQMGRQALRRITQNSINDTHPENSSLVRATCEHLPFECDSFDTVFATFPAPFIYLPDSISEISSVLKQNGRLVILLGVWITGKRLSDRFLKLFYQITLQSPPPSEDFPRYEKPFVLAGFVCETKFIEQEFCRLLFILARKKTDSPLEESLF